MIVCRGASANVCVLCADCQVFVKLLGHWLVETGIGKGTLAMCCAVMFCICMGCCCQYVECRKIPEKIKSFRAGGSGSARDVTGPQANVVSRLMSPSLYTCEADVHLAVRTGDAEASKLKFGHV
jgi:hypothetical protein